MLRPWKSDGYTHEDIVIQRYDWLLGWSMKLTGYKRDEAEDLVHDAFVEFTLSAPDLSTIHNMEGYLYGMLRNIHVSRVRRASRMDRQSVNLLDYDSAEIWLRSIHIDSLIYARELLRRVCDYACERKETSKAGSILILRFFHGYYPGEIARIALCQRRAVDDWMLIARREARSHIDQGAVERPAATGPGLSTYSSNDFLEWLRRRIYDSKKGRCLSDAQIEERYSGTDERATADRKLLAHICSCPSCLERINKTLNLPPLSDRFPTDMLGNDAGDTNQKRLGIRPAPARGIKDCRRLARSVYQHEPSELTIMANGFFVASETLNGVLSEQTLAVNTTERLSIVEAFSEQNVRLLGLHVEMPPEGPLNQSSRVELSDGRYLELSLSFQGLCPSLRSTYYDPRQLEPTLLGRASEALRPIPRPAPGRPSESLRPALALTPDRPRPEKVPRGRSLIRSVLETLVPRLRPATVAAALSILVAAIIIALHFKTTTVSAAELLKQAAVADEKAAGQPDTAIHRRLVLEERTVAGPVFVTRRQLDVWSSPVAGLKGCRVYDDNGLLIAGEWINSAGVHSIYRRDTSIPLRDSGPGDLATIIDSGEIWRIGLSAKEFLSLIGQPDGGSVVQGPASYTINYDFGESSKLIRASLILNKFGLQALEEILVIRRPQGLIQCRLAEKSHETVPLREAKPSLFYPDVWIPGASGRAPSSNEQPEAKERAAPAAAALDDAAFNSLKLEAMERLHRTGACIGGQLNFTRTASGRLGIQLLSDNEKRKSEIITDLGPLARNPAVELEVRTFEEAAARRPRLPADNLIVRRIEVDREQVPAYSDLKKYFGATAGANQPAGDEAAVNSRIERFAAGILRRSRQAVLHVWALKHHVQDAEGLGGAEQRSLLAKMIADHLRAIENETGRISVELAPIFPPPSIGPGDNQGTADPIGSLDRLYELVLSNENAITEAFTVNAGGERPACPIKTAEFWRSLRNTERLAASMLKRGG